jgi:uncharacterized protein
MNGAMGGMKRLAFAAAFALHSYAMAEAKRDQRHEAPPPSDSEEGRRYAKMRYDRNIETANAGDAAAQFEISQIYRHNCLEICFDGKTSDLWLRKSAVSGHIPAQIKLAESLRSSGSAYYNPKELDESKYWYQKAADQGSGEAFSGLAVFYSDGLGVPKDAAKAFALDLRAAELGQTWSMRRVAYSYYSGGVVPKDESKYFFWLKKIVELGDSWGSEIFHDELKLASAYYYGIGGEKNPVEAATWTKIAADRGDASGMLRMAALYVSGDGVVKDRKAAVKYRELAITKFKQKLENNRSAYDAVTLGHIYASDLIVRPNPSLAAQYFSSALGLEPFNKIHGVARYELARIYERGDGLPRDMRYAAALMQIAARDNQSAADAMKEPAYAAISVIKPGEEYKEYLNTAGLRMQAEQGDAIAQYEIGQAYLADGSLSQNRDAAKGWFNLSAKQGNKAARAALASLTNSNR